MINLNLPVKVEIYANPRDQKKAEELLRRFPEIMCKAYERGAKRFATILLRIVKTALATGNPPPGSGVSWPPLSPKTIKAYKSWGYTDTHLWYVMGQMYRRVGIQQSRGKKKELSIGFPRGVRATHPNKKARRNLNRRPTIESLAQSLEVGGNKVPPRPLFSPAYKVAGGKQRLNRFIVEELRKELRKYK